MSDIQIAGATYNDVPSILVPKVGGGFAEYTEGEVTQAEFDALKDAFTANLIHDTATGAIVNISDGAALPVRDLSVDIEPVQNLNGYDNPWPAGGGVNKLIECVPGTYTGTYCQAVVSADETITVSGTTGDSSDTINIPLKAKITTPSEQFYVHMFNTRNVNIAPSFELSTNFAGTTINASCAPANRIYTVPTDRLGVEIDRVRFWIAANTDATVTLHPMFALTNSVVPWTPYSNICPISGWTGGNIHVSPTTDAEDGTTYSITFPAEAGTVYGGTLDVTQGKLTVDKVAVTIDGNNIKFDRVMSYGTLKRFGTVYPSGLSAKYTGNTTYCIADKLTPSYNNTIAINYDRPEGYYCFPYSSAFFVSMPSSTITSIAEANAWAGDNTPKVVYELATPIVYDLTPTEVSTLLGTNNIFADCGDSTVDYYADPTLYINRKIAAAVAAMS